MLFLLKKILVSRFKKINTVLTILVILNTKVMNNWALKRTNENEIIIHRHKSVCDWSTHISSEAFVSGNESVWCNLIQYTLRNPTLIMEDQSYILLAVYNRSYYLLTLRSEFNTHINLHLWASMGITTYPPTPFSPLELNKTKIICRQVFLSPSPSLYYLALKIQHHYIVNPLVIHWSFWEKKSIYPVSF